MAMWAYITAARREIAGWIDRTSLFRLAWIFFAVVFIFAIVYNLLTPFSQGLVNNADPHGRITLGVACYFSVVTVSTLGYGDILPQGISRILACSEVIFGLGMMGVIIAKLTSARLSYHVRRLFSSDTQRRLEVFSAAFELMQAHFLRLSPRIGQAFQETPNATGTNEQAECSVEFNKALSELHSRSSAFCRDIVYELEQGDFFSDAPSEALQKTAGSIEVSLFMLGQLIFSFPILARPILLSADNRRRISETLDCHRALYLKVKIRCKDEELKNTFRRIAETCDNIPQNYFNIPRIEEERTQPNQVAPAVDQPQQAQ